MFEGLGSTLASWGQGAGNYIKDKPEQFAIIADMIGSRLDPNNAFAGSGTMMGQSSLANKAAAAQQGERQQMMQMLLPLLGGQAPVEGQNPAMSPGGAQPVSEEKPQELPKVGGFDINSLTAPDQSGPTKVSFAAGKDGSIQQNVISNASGKKPTTGVNLSDLLPLLLAQSGKTPVNLTGLTPEQILGVSRNDLALGQLNNQTVSTLFDSLYRKAMAEAELGKVDSYNANQYASAEKSRTEMLVKIEELLMKQDLHPVEKEKLIQEKNRLLTQQQLDKANATQSYASANSSNASAAKTRQDMSIEGQRQALIKNIPEGTKLEDIPLSGQITLLGNNFQDWAANQSRERMDKAKGAYSALLNSSDEDKASAADVTQWNSDAPDTATFGMLWKGEKGMLWDDDPAPKQVALPEGVTMKDIRDTAKLRNISVDEVLRKIYEADLTRR